MNAVAEQFTKLAEVVDTPREADLPPDPGGPRHARATVVRSAAAPSTPLSRHVAPTATVGGVLGLIAGFGIAGLASVSQTTRRRREPARMDNTVKYSGPAAMRRIPISP